MATESKRQKAMQKIDPLKAYALEEAYEIIKSGATAKFNESIDISINLGIDARKSDQNVRSATVLPAGNGKTVRVAAFAQGEQAKAAKDAGADIVGTDDLVASIKEGNLDFDVVIAAPDTMRFVGQLGTILGPRGLMPNPKVGTVTADVATAVKNAKSGQVRYRNDKGGIIHCSIGKADFSIDQIRQNLMALLQDIKKAKPSSAKGVYFKKVSLSSTMGAGVLVDISSLDI